MKLTREQVQFTIKIEQDDSPVRGHFASGDPEQDLADENEILSRLDRGDEFAWFGIIVRASWSGHSVERSVWANSYDESGTTPEQVADDQGLFEETLNELNTLVANEPALRIAEILSGQEWSGDTCNDIAEVLRNAGFTISEIDENEES